MRPFLKELFTVALIIKYDISTFSPVFKRISFLRLDINVMIPQNMLQWDTILAARSAPAHDNFALKWLISAASMRDRSRVYVPSALCRVLLLFPASLISVLQGHVPTSVRLLLTDVGVCRGNGKPKSCQFCLDRIFLKVRSQQKSRSQRDSCKFGQYFPDVHSCHSNLSVTRK